MENEMSIDQSCFIDYDGQIQFTRDLESNEYECKYVNDGSRTFIGILLIDKDDTVGGEYDLHGSLNDLLTCEGFPQDQVARAMFEALLDACAGIPRQDRNDEPVSIHAQNLFVMHWNNIRAEEKTNIDEEKLSHLNQSVR